MLRSQILLTPEIDKEIRKISKKQKISQSKTVRKLLSIALGTSSTTNPTGQSSSVKEYVYDLNTFTQSNQRIDGFKEIFSVGGRTTEVKIIGDEVFRYYLNNKKLPSNLEHQLLTTAATLQQASQTNKLVVRRAYIVPGLENPPGPRFLGLKLNEVVDAVKKIYDFAIENEYHVSKQSQIVVFLHPFVDPEPISIPIKTETILPYGGYATPLNKRASRVEVFAVWGNNEGVQSFDAIDRYVVDTDRDIVLTKDTPQKNLMLCTTTKAQSDKITVPLDKQFEQVLSDIEILETARVVKELTGRYGLRRVEFSFDGIEGIVFNESAKYEIHEKKILNLDKKGSIRTISSEKDVEKLKKLNGENIKKTIIYINKRIVEDRAYDVLNSVAGLSNKFTVLYPGLSATAHAMRVLNDFGHNAVVVGNRAFEDGQEILVKVTDGQVEVNILSKSSVKNYLMNLYDARLFGVDIVGGKAVNLSLLKTKGFNVPHGWVLTTSLFDRISEEKEVSEEKFTKLWKQIAKNIPLEKNKRYAVRSSATVEDHLEHSFAGQFATYLDVKKSDIKDKVLAVVDSTFNKQVETYQKALNQEKPIKMAVVIQEMVDADKSGVVFGKDVQTRNSDHIVIDVARGLGEGVVDGLAKTQRIIYSRDKNEIINKRNKSNKAIAFLSKVETNSLIDMSFSIEKLMGGTQDIEWAIDKQNNVWIVQSRDLN